jgi:RHS repeat-associated protein
LIAEYKPQTGEYFYYMTDQINSTRIITNDSGNVVFSEAYGPYGDVQKTWINTYDPKLKFSGKEREGYSELDYFGARYFDNKSYRFNSVDPIINKDEALVNPQLWNLYAYCRNNPISFVDPTGALENFTFSLNNQNTSYLEGSGMSIPAFSGFGKHTNNPSSINVVGIGPLPTGKYYIVDRPKGLKEKIFGAGKKENWFALFRADDNIDDVTYVYVDTNKFVERDQIRLHFGEWSAGCLTIKDEKDYEKLREKLLSTETGNIPGTNIKHYGTVEVKSPHTNLKEN